MTSAFGKGLKGFRALKWWTPFSALPHGICGVVGLLSGVYLVQGALLGPGEHSYTLATESTEPKMDILVLYVYVVSSFMNSLAGYFLADKAPGKFRAVFRNTAVLQMFLVYFIYRFMTYINNYALSLLDLLAALGILTAIGIMFYKVTVPVKGQPNIKVPVAIGCFCLALLAGYPLQLAMGGKPWYDCVLQQYPMQQVGFVYYVYVPATFTFGAMMFGATLLLRKIISEAVFGVVFVGLILFTLLSTVLLQEIHIPWVSTQKLLINCPEDQQSFIYSLSNILDTSTLARSVLQAIGAIQE
mmetsp:Transcript_10240/g.11803  ORF Transcript_10240/g.11803 Transcript_10240/m.11803 type:complete len:300 (-) Transcript_10240:96-995(-)